MLCAGCYTWEYATVPEFTDAYDHLHMEVDGFGMTLPNTPWLEPYAFCLGHAGCTNELALNFSYSAEMDDGSCVFETVANPCPQDLNGDGTVSVADLLNLLGAFGEECSD